MRLLILSVLVSSTFAFAQATGTVELVAGEQKVLDLPGIQRIAVGDGAVVDVKTIGNNQVLLTAQSEGKTTMQVWKSGGERLTYLLTVNGGEPELSRAPGGLDLEPGALVFFKATGITRIEVGDPKVIEATLLKGGRAQLRSKAAGHSDVVAFNEKTEVGRLSVDVGSGAAARSPQVATVVLKIGQSVALVVAGLSRAVSKNPKVVEVSVPNANAVVLVGRGVGDSTIDLTVGGATQTMQVTSTPR